MPFRSSPAPSPGFACFLTFIRNPVLGAFAATVCFPAYHRLVSGWGLADRLAFVLATSVVHSVLYFGLNGLFELLDSTGWLAEYKMERRPHQIPSSALKMKTIVGGMCNQFVIQPLMLWYLHPAFVHFGSPGMLAPLPSFPSLLSSFLGIVVFNEFVFYATHRMLHSKLFYRFHKQVCQFSQSCCLV